MAKAPDDPKKKIQRIYHKMSCIHQPRKIQHIIIFKKKCKKAGEVNKRRALLPHISLHVREHRGDYGMQSVLSYHPVARNREIFKHKSLHAAISRGIDPSAKHRNVSPYDSPHHRLSIQ